MKTESPPSKFKIPLSKACPHCKKDDCVQIENQVISCTQPSCNFSQSYQCPICNGSLMDSTFINSEKPSFTCTNCNSKVELRKIKYLIENTLYVDQDQRCGICNGPTIHHPQMNLSHRCFSYPLCAGQVNLFGNSTAESYIFIDLETTGREIGKDNIIEIGALKIDKEGYEHTFLTFVKPNGDIPEKITQITGITNDMVADAPSLSSTLEKLAEFIDDSVLVAHNADFDIPWLITAALRHQIPLNIKDTMCTLTWAKNHQEPRCGLGALTKKYNISHHNAHRALADAAATKELFFIFENTRKTPQPRRNIQEFITLSQRLVARYPNHIQQ